MNSELKLDVNDIEENEEKSNNIEKKDLFKKIKIKEIDDDNEDLFNEIGTKRKSKKKQ